VSAEARPFNIRTVQEFSTDATNGTRRLVREQHYVRLRRAPDEPPVYLAQGLAWSEVGERLEPVPKWVHDQVKKLTPAARQAIGWLEGHAPE
jgi:hypothetical protein